MEHIARCLPLPAVSRVYIPEPQPHAGKHTEFGVVALADGAAGLYYAWLGETQKGMQGRYSEADFIGRPPLELVQLLKENDDAARSLGMAAVNAISRHVLRRAGYRPPPAADSLGGLDPGAGDHLGMVGYFPSLVARLGESGIRVTVIEKKTRFTSDSPLVTISSDISELGACNKVLCTAATLLNDSVDDVITHAENAEAIAVIGPTASFLPDPLFRRGVTAVGGTEITDAARAITALREDSGLKEVERRYLIRREDYPGVEILIDKATEKSGEA